MFDQKSRKLLKVDVINVVINKGFCKIKILLENHNGFSLLGAEVDKCFILMENIYVTINGNCSLFCDDTSSINSKTNFIL